MSPVWIMPGCLMLFAALFNAACLYNGCLLLCLMLLVCVMHVYSLFFAHDFFIVNYTNTFCFHDLSLVYCHIVCFISYFASCTVLLVCWFCSFYVHTVFVYERAMCSLDE